MRNSNDPDVKLERKNITLIPGMKINKLTLVEYVNGGWVCLCDCGNPYFCSRPYRLKNELIGDVRDHTGSCGCIQRQNTNLKDKANRKGSIENKSIDYTRGGNEIICETEYRDNIRSIIVIAKCKKCNRLFLTVKRSNGKSCGCDK